MAVISSESNGPQKDIGTVEPESMSPADSGQINVDTMPPRAKQERPKPTTSSRLDPGLQGLGMLRSSLQCWAKHFGTVRKR